MTNIEKFETLNEAMSLPAQYAGVGAGVGAIAGAGSGSIIGGLAGLLKYDANKLDKLADEYEKVGNKDKANKLRKLADKRRLTTRTSRTLKAAGIGAGIGAGVGALGTGILGYKSGKKAAQDFKRAVADAEESLRKARERR